MSDSAELYQALIMDRSKNPRHAGRLENYDAEAEGDNPMCGDRVHVYLRRVGTGVSHESRGCAIMTASADLMAEAVAGKSSEQIAALKTAFETVVTTGEENPAVEKLNALAGVFAYRSRIRCATLPWSALAEALKEDQNHG
jgi:nitrogen fixation NifU-like protein